MKKTIYTSEAVRNLMSDSYARWTYSGALALVEFLEDWEHDSEEEIEFDVVQLRCDWSEYPSAAAAAEDWGWEWENDDKLEGDDEFEAKQKRAMEWLSDRTQVIEFDNGVVVANF